MPKYLPYYNADPEGEPATDRDSLYREFAKRLQAAMDKKGWNQSELARQASMHVASGKFGRDNISCYVRGKALPGPRYLQALAKALQMDKEDLLPTRSTPNIDISRPRVNARSLDGGKMYLQVNQTVPTSIGLKIMALLHEAENVEDDDD